MIHAADSHESIALHRGDAALPSGHSVEVLIFDELTPFTGDFALTLEQAWRVIGEFIRSGSPGDLATGVGSERATRTGDAA